MSTYTSPNNIFSYRKYWAKRFGTAPFLPMSRSEMENLEWDSCDIIIVTGDAYVDHPSFGMAIIGRLLEAQGFRVGIISQPDWRSVDAFKVLGKPNLFFGITSGNMDSMVNHYTADRKIRSDDAYTPDGIPNKRPNHATNVYSHRCREAYPEVPIILGGIEASLRRLGHYDYWSDQVRRSILLDAKADIILYGNAERAIVELAHCLAKKESITNIKNLRGSVVVIKPEEKKDFAIIDTSSLNCSRYYNTPSEKNSLIKTAILLPSYEQIKNDNLLFAHATRIAYLESNPFNARTLLQPHDRRCILVNPPPLPLSTKELDGIYELPYSRKPHPLYKNASISAYEMIRYSVTIMRGCFGGCSFCSITLHEGRIVQNRSESSILREIEIIRDKVPEFTGIISDLGGPTANMYSLKCTKPKCEQLCRKFSCIYPAICKNMQTNHSALINLYRKARSIPKIKKILIGSGVRYDLAVKSPEYIKELACNHVGGYLKIAPEHICDGPLSKMQKPGIDTYYNFKELFCKFSQEVKKEQYLIPYFIAAHPGTKDQDMIDLALWLKSNNFRLEKVQNFLPTPMTISTTMYYTERNPLRNIEQNQEKVFIPKSGQTRRFHKALLRYHDPINWPFLRRELKRIGRTDLIGNGKRHLVPTWQPKSPGI